MAAPIKAVIHVEERFAKRLTGMLKRGEVNSLAGPISALVSAKFSNSISQDLMDSFLAADQNSAEKIMQFLPEGSNVIVKSVDKAIYPEIMENLNDLGKEAVESIHPWVLNTFVDWGDYDQMITSRPLPSAEEITIPASNSSSAKGLEPQDSSSMTESDALKTQEEEFTWTQEKTRLLIELYRDRKQEFNKPIKKIIIWKDIAKEMTKYGSRVDWNTCERKFRNLKQHFKTVNTHNKKSGNNRRKWEYQNAMQEILKDDPAIFPKSLKGTLTSTQSEVSLSLPDSESTASTSTLIPSQTPSKKKSCKRPSPEWFLDYMEKHTKKQAEENQKRMEEIKRMHDEMIQIQNDKIEELKKMNSAFIAFLEKQ